MTLEQKLAVRAYEEGPCFACPGNATPDVRSLLDHVATTH